MNYNRQTKEKTERRSFEDWFDDLPLAGQSLFVTVVLVTFLSLIGLGVWALWTVMGTDIWWVGGGFGTFLFIWFLVTVALDDSW